MSMSTTSTSSTAVANEGPRMKRIRPAPMGRAFRYQRRLAHIIVTVAEKKSATAVSAAAEPTSTGSEEDHEEGSHEDCGKKPAAKKAAAKKTATKKAAK